MVTREQLETALDDETKDPFKTPRVDYDVLAINLLRERVPYDKCSSIIKGAGHDTIYLTSVDMIVDYLSEADLDVLADCNLFIDDDNDCLAMFV